MPKPSQLLTDLENAVAFRLFEGRQQAPTLTVPEQIAAQVGDAIIKGKLLPGEALNEQRLADSFHVSRGPVRDAIRILEREGLATIYPRRGAVVTDLSVDEVRDIFEIRVGLLEIVARKIAARHSPEYLATLRAGVEKLETLARLENDQGRYAETSYRLSILSVRNCNNPRLTQMLTALSLQTLRYSYISLASPQRRRASAALWRKGLDALERGDAATYIAISRQRVEDSGNAVVQRLSQPIPQPARRRA
ncbi:GntR family transcriptional regulator [Bordetella petrii]|uniref:GntR family transcriptional regulator n=1 Tax=Bordetella petrii TaxID=94624 RepID=UPI001E43825B|nr:GntR family transcriptional regulator [Bordetella petrii]MCD0501779.1 GntR family transcriptional regulator [Bordetella petrii]